MKFTEDYILIHSTTKIYSGALFFIELYSLYHKPLILVDLLMEIWDKNPKGHSNMFVEKINFLTQVVLMRQKIKSVEIV